MNCSYSPWKAFKSLQLYLLLNPYNVFCLLSVIFALFATKYFHILTGSHLSLSSMGAGTFLKLHPSTSMTSNDIKFDGYDLIKSNYFIDSKRDGVCLYYKIFFDRMFSAYHCVKCARIQVFSDPYFPV